ncbi:Polycomb complex protein BMI-1 [Eufriesea mexicana]|uniref:protein PF14_0175-like n=1 Tax=Eufriesea mexicana TaxID=516756 RepID=UPI00083C59AF|nr:PREDICTED: protein PF14_0175-like [Eufriesea mexicana]OAD56640.1 Polycomb complex protein BMI-1 [Eufriesea mexicana]
MSGQSGGHRLRLSKLNDQLTCKLCSGYFIDATTIIECLHSFCRSCIVKYLENNKYCPICEVQVHKSKPLLNIRPDHTLQDIVYKLVPGCYQNEMRCRREFYSKYPEACTQATSPEARGEPIESHIYSPDESLSLSLEYFSPSKDVKGIAVKSLLRRYLRCPAAVTIFHLQKLIRAKYGLTDAHRVDVMYKEEPLCSSYTLMDVMYIYHWRRKVPLHLSYRIFESSPKRIKLSEDNVNYKTSLLHAGIDPIESKEEKSIKREWKEVQLKISETGIMSITGITDQQFKKNTRVEDPITSVETINTSIIEDSANRNNMSEVSKENEQSLDRKSVNESDISSKLNKFNDQKSSNQTEAIKTSIKEVDNINSKLEEESKNLLDNNNIEDKSILQKSSQSQEITQYLSEYEIRNNNIENKDQKETSKNNNNIIMEKLETSKQNSKNEVKFVNTGSKINALSVKLQFQPKIGSNNASSKKIARDRKIIPQSSKKVDIKITESLKSAELKNSFDSSKAQVMTNNCGVTISKSLIPYSTKTISQKSISELQDNVESVLSTYPSTSISSEVKETEINIKHVQSVDQKEEYSVQGESTSEKKPYATDQILTESCQRTSEQTNTLLKKSPYTQIEPLTNDNLTSLNLSTSLPMSVGNGINSSVFTSTISQSTSTFPYTVQDLVNSTMLKSSLKSLTASTTQKLSATTVSENEVPTSSVSENPTAFTIPSINVSSSLKNSYPSSSTSKESVLKANLEITNTYSVPPCPDAIPISLMKPTIRKTELITKGSNLNEICAKIGASGSKINDICAKIGENSKEKNKTEARSKSDIPDLLKIGRKNGSPSITIDSTNKLQQHTSIPNVPVYAPNSNAITTESKNIYSNVKDSLRATSLITTSPIATSHSLQKVLSISKKQSQAVGYKTLRDPPKCWNPTLSKNNYVAVKNQSKETQNQLHQTTLFERSKTIQSKPAKIFKMRNMPRYLGNPASGVKPMYGIGNECKEKEQSTMTSTTTTTNTSSSSKNGNLSMMKIDPKTLSPIVSTVNSPIVSPPPYSPSARNYPNPPFSRDICRSTGSPISPKNSPVNMLSTSPFIPSPTPNMNPRLIYSHFPPPFPDATRFPNPLIRSPIGIPSPSAFHSNLPPSINKLYQRSSYIPQTTGFSPVSQPPTVQRIPPSTYSSPKSPKTTSLTAISPASYNLVKPETQTIATTSLETNNLFLPESTSQEDVSAFNLSKTGNFCNTETVKVLTETVRNSKSTSLSSSSSIGQNKNASIVNSKTKLETSPLSTGDQDQNKERVEKEAIKCKEQNLCTSKVQNSEKNRFDGDSDSVNIKKENSTTQINGDLTSENKEEIVAEKNIEQQSEQNETKIIQVSEKIIEKEETEEPKNEKCEKSEGQQNNSEIQNNKTET